MQALQAVGQGSEPLSTWAMKDNRASQCGVCN